MKRLLITILFLVNQIVSAQCALTNLTDDLVGTSNEFKTLLNTNEEFGKIYQKKLYYKRGTYLMPLKLLSKPLKVMELG